MSKASALALFGTPQAAAPELKPSLITPDVATGEIVKDDELAQDIALAEAPKDDLQSSRLAIVAKKEAAILKEREALKKEREELLKEKEEATAIKKKDQDFSELSKKDKIAALKSLGWSDTDIINIMANAENKTETGEEAARRIAQEETQKMRDELKEERENLQKQQNEHLVGKLRSDISSQIKSNVEKYEYCSFEENAAEDIYETIVEELKSTGNLLSVEEASEIMETLYEEKDKAREKLKKRGHTAVGAPTSTKDGEVLKSNTPQADPVKSKTLTNAVTATSASLNVKRRETESEKKARLAEKLRSGMFG